MDISTVKKHLKSLEWVESLPQPEKYQALQTAFEQAAINFLKSGDIEKAIELFNHAKEHATNHNDLERAKLNSETILELSKLGRVK